MVGILILTHGRMAEELLQAARHIAGDMERFEALALNWTDSAEEAETKVKAAIARLEEGDGVLVLTDIFGGTPSNVAMGCLAPGKVEIVSGVNLPMVVRLGCWSTAAMPLPQLTAWIQEKGRSSICSSHQLPSVKLATAKLVPCGPDENI